MHRPTTMTCGLVWWSAIVIAAASLFVMRACEAAGYVMTENQIKEDIKFLSQSTPDGAKPSRLRALLLADLRRALPTTEVNCTADADLRLAATRCTCTAVVCPAAAPQHQQPPPLPLRSSNYGKRSSRIQRSCADYCCRRTAAVQKSISASPSTTATAAAASDRCEIAQTDVNWELGNGTTAGVPPTLMPGIVQIFGGKSKQPMCIGTLVHARVVMTTLVCATTQLSDRLRIKVRETVDRYQFRYQVRNVTRRIYPRNYAELNRQFGFNMALLVLAEPVHLNAQTRPACWSREPFDRDAAIKRGVRCFVDSLENKNGLMMERREPVTMYPVAHCQRRYAEQRRAQMFFPKSSMCAGRPDESDIAILQNGAPLHCMHGTATGYRYVQYGMLAWSAAINPAPHLFANVSNYRNWLDKQLAEVLQS